jgi:branched-chain amino acid transport system permease protein
MLRIHKTPIMIAILFILGFPLICSAVPVIANYTDIMIFAGIYCLITIGLSLLMGYAGQISLGHAAFFGIGAYVSGILSVRFGINPWLCMVCGMLAAAVVAVAVGAPSLRLRGYYLAMATLAFGIIVNIIFREEIEWTGGPDGLVGIPAISLMGFEFDTIKTYYYLVWAVVLVAFLFAVRLIQSPAGRALRAIHASEAASSAMGINISKYKIIVFVYSAVLASVAGSLYAHYMNFINPSTFDLFFSIKLIIMIALGGMHSIWGALVGTILITFMSLEWLRYFQEYEIIVYGVILIVVIIFLPYGLIGLPNVLRDKFRS